MSTHRRTGANGPTQQRALLFAWDKTGLADLGGVLIDLGWEIVSGGRTLAFLREAGLAAMDVAELIGFAPMLGGRVKTLHPAIHGAILADRSNRSHLDELEAAGIVPIDLVVTNFYPLADEPSLDAIDVGGPALVRAAAKNHEHVGVLVDPADYVDAARELAGGGLSRNTRRHLAQKAFRYTSSYDAEIIDWLGGDAVDPSGSTFPDAMHLILEKTDDLRLGENPHQRAARYRIVGQRDGWWDSATQHHGVAMSYLNLYDADAAWGLVHSLSVSTRPAAVIVKHGNPCGAAVGDTITAAWTRAYAGDDASAFGGIVALNQPVPDELARLLAETYTLVIIAPGFEPGALAVLRQKRAIRLISARPPKGNRLHVRSDDGGLLIQTSDAVRVDANGSADRTGWSVVTVRSPTPIEWDDLEFAWRIAARTDSNSIVLVKDLQAVGIGCGQQNRRDAGRIAAAKAAGRAEGGSCASDGFLAFTDGIDEAAEAGCTALIQPGGSIRDRDVIDAANNTGLAMVFTGQRHFCH